MAKKFIEELCEEEGLIDIGKFGKASQSSLSEWSQGRDAERAVNGIEYKDFAFHTNKEKNPWWQIDFGQLFEVEYIVLNNRRKKPFDEIASSLTILAYDHNNEEITLHSGTVFFGTETDGLPLVIPLQGKILLKRVKVILLKENYLHLSSIRFLIKDPLKQVDKNMVLVSTRSDGLGERLRALLNTMVLAKERNSHFMFSWKSMNSHKWSTMTEADIAFHATSEINEMFEISFQEKHLLNEEEVNKLRLYPIEKAVLIKAKELQSYDGLIVHQAKLSQQLPYPYCDFDSQSYNEAFNEIGFSKALLDSKKYAESIELPSKSVAIHIRAGDIVFGSFRDEPVFYSKVTPLYLLEYVIKKLIVASYKVVIFGQDDEFCSYLANKYGCLYSKNLLKSKGYDNSQVAIFDIVLMSRCIEIISGYSGFAILAEYIGGSIRRNCYDFLSNTKEAVKEFDVFYQDSSSFLYSENIHPLVKSFSIAQFVYRYKKHLPLTRIISLLEYCNRLDPTNAYHNFFLASLYYDSSKIKEADLLVINYIKKENLDGVKKLAKETRWKNEAPLTEFIDSFELAAKSGSIPASIILFIYEVNLKRGNIDYDFFNDLIVKSDNNTLGIELLKEIIKSQSH